MSAGRRPLLLASASPRRRALLTSAGIPVWIRPTDVDEATASGESPRDVVLRLARAKARAGLEEAPDQAESLLVLGADTVVVAGGRILGKPSGEAEAREMLTALAGTWHEVHTGWCLLEGAEERRHGVATTRVRFKALDSVELDYYLATGEWRDKAGAYGIQGAAAFFVAELEGSYTNVVGLPLAEVVSALGEAGLSPEVGVPAPSPGTSEDGARLPGDRSGG